MKKTVKKAISFICASALILACLLAVSCQKRETVVVYTSVDQFFSEKVFAEFERQTGIQVKAVYDIEASKTTGLVNRLIAEKDKPQADVFWNGEFSGTFTLKKEGVLQSADITVPSGLPSNFKDSEKQWYAFGGRARVIIINTNLISEQEAPSSLLDLAEKKFGNGKAAAANPVFGTSATQAAAFFMSMGGEKAKEYYRNLKDNGVEIVDGNSVVKDMVADGRASYGLTDSDDALEAIESGKPVKMLIPDQGEGQFGCIVIPNTAAVIKNAPNLENAKKFMEFLLSAETERLMAEIDWIQVTPLSGSGSLNIQKYFDIDFEKINNQIEASTAAMKDIFVQ